MSGHVAERPPELGPLFELEERKGPKVEGATFEGPEEDDEPARRERLGGQLADIFEANLVLRNQLLAGEDPAE